MTADVAGLWAALTGVRDDPVLTTLDLPDGPQLLPSVHRVRAAALATVATATLAVAVFGAERTGGPGAVPPPVRVGGREAEVAFRSERYLRLDGRTGRLWEPLSGDYRSVDGWVRLHANFAHHVDAACRALEVPPRRDAVAAALARWRAVEAEDAVIAAGGAAGALRTAQEWADHPHRAVLAARPVIDVRRIDGSTPAVGARTAVPPTGRGGRPGRPLAGLRVLDLTRMIAGPVAGRVLTSWGADVLAVRGPHLPTVPWLDLDNGFGKRWRLLDLRAADDRDAFLTLVRRADAVVQSYRPGALDRWGLGASDLAAVRPGLGHVSVSAYGDTGPWAGRRGFDSVVQLVTGLADTAMRATGSDRPVPLPGQVLDHAAGWLAAAGVVETVRRARRDGGSWRADVTLAGVAGWLDGLGRVDAATVAATPDPGLDDVADLLTGMHTSAGLLRYVRPPGTIGRTAPLWESPSPFPPPDPVTPDPVTREPAEPEPRP